MTTTLHEIYTAYETRRQAWIAQFGTDNGFNDWFTKAFNKSVGR